MGGEDQNGSATAPFGGLTPSEAGKRSAAARAGRKSTPEDDAQAQIRRRLGKLTAELLDAALGEGAFTDLKPTDRLKALQRALEYGLGRPGAAKPADEAPEVPSAAGLFGTGGGE